MSLDDLYQHLAQVMRGKVARNEPLARFTTYRLGGPASIYVEPADAEDVARLGEALGDDVEILVVGRGSNLVISDEGWPGVAIRLGSAFSFVEPVDEGLRAGAATALPLLANWAARRGLAGMEFTIAIPGSVGGAVRMNAGAHGTEIRDHLTSAEVFDLVAKRSTQRSKDSFSFSYRNSNVTESDLVLNATFRLAADDPEAVKARMEAHRKHRAETQPGAVQNAGSVFRNPDEDHAGRLVEATGLKGFRIGGARVSEVHANFFIAGEGSTAQDVFDLVGEVRRRVEEAHGVNLTPEIRFVGAFRDHAGEVKQR